MQNNVHVNNVSIYRPIKNLLNHTVKTEFFTVSRKRVFRIDFTFVTLFQTKCKPIIRLNPLLQNLAPKRETTWALWPPKQIYL